MQIIVCIRHKRKLHMPADEPCKSLFVFDVTLRVETGREAIILCFRSVMRLETASSCIMCVLVMRNLMRHVDSCLCYFALCLHNSRGEWKSLSDSYAKKLTCLCYFFQEPRVNRSLSIEYTPKT